MRKKLLSFVALVMVAMGMNAQTWTKPTVTGVVSPYAVSLEDHLTSADELSPSLDVANAVYLYNVAAEGFLGGGNSWGTRTSIKVASGGDNRPDLPYFICDVTENYNNNIALSPVEGEQIVWLYSPKSKNNYLTFRDDAIACWVDLGNQSHNGQYWRVEEAGDYYRFKSPKTHPTFGEDLYPNWEYEYFGWNGKNDNNVASANIDPREQGVGVDWLLISAEGFAAYQNASPLINARTALYEQAQIVVNEELGEYGVSYEEYTDVYNGTDIAAINAATQELAAKVVEARKAKAWATGTEENPSDVTFLLTNPFFNGSINGWTVDVPGAQNTAYQGASYTNTDSADDDPNHGVGIGGFIEAWVPGKGLGSGKIYQQVELPLGKYVLGVDIIACNQYNGDSRENANGVQLYALGGGIDNGTEVRTYNGQPEHYDFEFITAGGTTELGLRVTDATANWIAADNFTLKYRGNDVDPFYFALPTLVETCENEVDVEANPANNAVKNAYKEALENARNLIGEEEGDFEGVYKALSEAKDNLAASVAAYQRLSAFVTKVSNDLKAYEKNTELNSAISELYDNTYLPGLEDETATNEQIEEWISNYDSFLLGAVKDAMASATEEAPLLISIFGKNLDYANNSTTEGWTVTTGSVSGGGSYKVNYHNGEVWKNTFACLQTIADMPAGKYTIKAKAFYRDAPNADHYDLFVSGEADITTYLVAGSNKTPVPALALAAIESTTQPEGSYYTETVAAQTDENGNIIAEGSGIWMPNSQQAAEWAFNNDEDLQCEVSTYLAQDGDLTFGTRNDAIQEGNDQWSVWTQFEIYYMGKDQNALYEQVVALGEQASELMSDPQYTMVEAGNEKLNDAVAASEAAKATDSEEVLTAIVEKINEAMAYVQEGRQLAEELMGIVEIYTTKKDAESIISTDKTFDDLFTSINAAISAESFESNEVIKSWIEQLPSAWIGFVMGQDMEGASAEEPFDITAIIFNADLEDIEHSTREQAPPYWQVDALGKNNGYQDNNTYSNAEGDITLDHFIESWTPSGTLADGQISQTLAGALPAGFYRLEVDGKSSSTAVGIEFGVTDGTKSWTVPVVSDDPAHWSVNFESDGTSVLTIGIFVKETNATWIAFDNFKLGYIGSTAPDAVEGIAAEGTAKPAAIYNLAGQRVQKAIRGLYIINGRKVVIK